MSARLSSPLQATCEELSVLDGMMPSHGPRRTFRLASRIEESLC